MRNDMLELKNVSFQVAEDRGDKEIIRGVSLAVPESKLVVITGPNGGGKSTLARLIAGIEKPTEGRILFQGEDITEKSITDRARLGIAYAFQQPVRFKGIKVLDLIRIAAGKHLAAAGACEYLSAVGLCARDYIDREVNASLSGGELKRIEIATVLARGAALSVFDSSSPIRSGSSTSPTRSWCSRTAGWRSRGPGTRSCPSSWAPPPPCPNAT